MTMSVTVTAFLIDIFRKDFKKKKMAKEFNVGKVVVTTAVDELMQSNYEFQRFVTLSLGKHVRGNWGNMSPDDRKKNDEALENGERIMSVYYRPGMKKEDPQGKIWIITEADRSSTTILFPEDY